MKPNRIKILFQSKGLWLLFGVLALNLSWAPWSQQPSGSASYSSSIINKVKSGFKEQYLGDVEGVTASGTLSDTTCPRYKPTDDYWVCTSNIEEKNSHKDIDGEKVETVINKVFAFSVKKLEQPARVSDLDDTAGVETLAGDALVDVIQVSYGVNGCANCDGNSYLLAANTPTATISSLVKALEEQTKLLAKAEAEKPEKDDKKLKLVMTCKEDSNGKKIKKKLAKAECAAEHLAEYEDELTSSQQKKLSKLLFPTMRSWAKSKDFEKREQAKEWAETVGDAGINSSLTSAAANAWDAADMYEKLYEFNDNYDGQSWREMGVYERMEAKQQLGLLKQDYTARFRFGTDAGLWRKSLSPRLKKLIRKYGGRGRGRNRSRLALGLGGSSYLDDDYLDDDYLGGRRRRSRIGLSDYDLYDDDDDLLLGGRRGLRGRNGLRRRRAGRAGRAGFDINRNITRRRSRSRLGSRGRAGRRF